MIFLTLGGIASHQEIKLLSSSYQDINVTLIMWYHVLTVVRLARHMPPVPAGLRPTEAPLRVPRALRVCALILATRESAETHDST